MYGESTGEQLSNNRVIMAKEKTFSSSMHTGQITSLIRILLLVWDRFEGITVAKSHFCNPLEAFSSSPHNPSPRHKILRFPSTPSWMWSECWVWQFAPRCATIIIGTALGPLSVISKQMAGLQFREKHPVQFIFCRRAFRARSKVLVGTWAKRDPAATLELLLHICLCGCESTSIERTGFQTHRWKALYSLIAARRF